MEESQKKKKATEIKEGTEIPWKDLTMEDLIKLQEEGVKGVMDGDKNAFICVKSRPK